MYRKFPYCIIASVLSACLAACSGTANNTEAPDAGHPADDLTKNPSAKISHESGWTIISKTENGNRVYWFLAPEVDNVSPAMFKKTVYTTNKHKLENKLVSQCDAPKQTCDELMKKFKSLSDKYR